MKITTRLILLIFVQLIALGALGYWATNTIDRGESATENLKNDVDAQLEISQLIANARTGLVATALDTHLGTITWESSIERLANAKASFEEAWGEYTAELSADEREYVQDIHGYTLTDMRSAFTELERLISARNRDQLALFMRNDFTNLTSPYFESLQARANQLQFLASQNFDEIQTLLDQRQQLTLIGIVVALVVLILLNITIYRSIANPVSVIANTVQAVGAGNLSARTKLTGGDELSRLGQALDQLLQDRVATLSQAQQENEQLNNSIISLLQAVYQLSQRDLTVKVPVTEDVTGPLADALNLLTDETAKVLGGVNRLSRQVTTASDTVRSQSENVIQVAEKESQEVDYTAQELASAAAAMQRIAELANVCDQAAEKAITTTRQALDTVNATVGGINNTRDRIRETEKRIKRLGERSQEIGSIVNLINGIAERTHILALNASMHAASAGEAGRGFAVVATEVQRLAENAREATAQIATLVSNIQAETSETVETMNATISEVVEGSRLAEEAGSQMRFTQESTANLVQSVQQIAVNSREQADISQRLTVRASAIRESTHQTSQQLAEQRQQTDNLVRYARELADSIQVFKLPADGAEADKTNSSASAAA